MPDENSDKSLLRRAYDSAKGAASSIGSEARELAKDVGGEVKRDFDYVRSGDFRNGIADSLREHGKNRLKTGGLAAAKAAAISWKVPPVAKFAVPAAFVLGMVGGRPAANRIASWVEKKKDPGDSSGTKPTDPSSGPS